MKLSEWIIVFFVIFGCFSLLAFYSINTSSRANNANIQYTNVLTTACHDAVKTVDIENVEKGQVWGKKEDREYALSTFYHTLQLGFNSEYTTKGDETFIYTPIACLIDNDGYYISYNSSFDETGNTYRPIDSTDKSAKLFDTTLTISPLNTWAKEYNGCVVRFYLNDTVEVTLPSGEIIKDKRSKVTKALVELKDKGKLSSDVYNIKVIQDKDGIANKYSVMELLENTDGIYDVEKREIIINLINEEVEYYINHQNIWGEALDVNYTFTMPEIKSEDWHRLLSNPTMISFLQGMQAKTKRNYVNVYALAGGEFTTARQYYITQDGSQLTYHLINGKCAEHSIEHKKESVTEEKKEGGFVKQITYIDEYFTCDGERIEKLYDSMETCAEIGAYPCSCVINYNDVN